MIFTQQFCNTFSFLAKILQELCFLTVARNDFFVRILQDLARNKFFVYTLRSDKLCISPKSKHIQPSEVMVCMSVCDIFMSVLVGTAAVPAFNHPFRYPSFVCQGQAIMLTLFQVSLLSLLKNSIFFLEFSAHM